METSCKLGLQTQIITQWSLVGAISPIVCSPSSKWTTDVITWLGGPGWWQEYQKCWNLQLHRKQGHKFKIDREWSHTSINARPCLLLPLFNFWSQSAHAGHLEDILAQGIKYLSLTFIWVLLLVPKRRTGWEGHTGFQSSAHCLTWSYGSGMIWTQSCGLAGGPLLVTLIPQNMLPSVCQTW